MTFGLIGNRRVCVWFGLGLLVLACSGGSNRSFRGSFGAGGVAQAAGSGGAVSVAGAVSVGGTTQRGVAGAAGEESFAGDGGSGGTGAPPECDAGTLRCSGNSREECDEQGTWRELPNAEQCGGGTPICTGNGMCAGYVLSGSIDSLGALSPPNSPRYVLVQQSLVEFLEQCNADYCVTGAVHP